MNEQGRAVIESYAGRTVLGIGAHPDDLELGVGGTLALLRQVGARVVMAIVSVPSLLEERRAEAARAATLLGCELRFLFADRCRRVEDLKSYELVGALDALVEEYRPAAVLTHGTSNFHRDHVLVYNACLAGERTGYYDLFCYYPTSTRPIPVAFWPQAFVDISQTIETKMRAIGEHSSQFDCRKLGAEYCRDLARRYGRLAGVAYAEGLEVVRFRLS